jgi:hypothetical protein
MTTVTLPSDSTYSKRYSIYDYTNVIFNNNYLLSDRVLDIIQNLSVALNISNTTVSTKISSSSNRREYREKDRNNITDVNESWETLRSFKSTVIEKKEGIEKTIADIRSCLNKISAKNYEKNKEMIIQYINDNPEHIMVCAQSIFDIASTNKFFSEIYAELYRELIGLFEPFQTILTDFITSYVKNIQDIKYANPEENYDKFCLYNKKNDIRKATSTFITNLVKKGVLNVNILISLIGQIESILFESIEVVDKKNEVEEIVENLYILITESFIIFKPLHNSNNPFEFIQGSDSSNESPRTLYENQVLKPIREFIRYKANDKPSISTRAIFKCMDIIDMEKKIK